MAMKDGPGGTSINPGKYTQDKCKIKPKGPIPPVTPGTTGPATTKTNIGTGKNKGKAKGY